MRSSSVVISRPGEAANSFAVEATIPRTSLGQAGWTPETIMVDNGCDDKAAGKHISCSQHSVCQRDRGRCARSGRRPHGGHSRRRNEALRVHAGLPQRSRRRPASRRLLLRTSPPRGQGAGVLDTALRHREPCSAQRQSEGWPCSLSSVVVLARRLLWQ